MLCEGEKLWWLFPCGIFLKQLGLVFAPLGVAGRAGSKLGQSQARVWEREGKRLVLLRTEWSLQGPLWLCSEPGKGGISLPCATGVRSVKKQLF